MMKLEKEFAQRKTDLLTKLEYQERTDYLNRQAQDIQTALNLDQATFNNYVQLASMDIDQIMLQAGIDYATAAAFKQVFSKFGELLMTKGLGITSAPFYGFSLS
jgi:hypothetical protein